MKDINFIRLFSFTSRLAVAMIAIHSLSFSLNGQDMKAQGPPYLAHCSKFIMVLFDLKPQDVKQFLPSAVEAKLNERGSVTAGLEIYETDRILGIPNYAIAFIFVEIEGMESNNGTPGHWAIWGNVNNKNSLQGMIQHFNFPYGFADITISKEEAIHAGQVGDGQVKLKLKANKSQPFIGEGVVNMCSALKDGAIIKTEVPWFSTGSVGEIVQFDIAPKGNKVLALVKLSTPYFGMISTDQTFSYSRIVRK